MAEPAQDPSLAGREEAHLREIAVRCERLSSSRWIDLAPAILAGAFCGMSAFMLFMPMVYRSLAQMPAAPGENWLIDSARALQWTARVWTILGLIALIFVGPRIARWIADWRLRSTTLPELRRWRKVRRRKSPRWLWPALSIPILAVYLLAPWQVSALITAKVLADTAGARLRPLRLRDVLVVRSPGQVLGVRQRLESPLGRPPWRPHRPLVVGRHRRGDAHPLAGADFHLPAVDHQPLTRADIASEPV
jgi:hypothetical protein